MNRNFRRVFAVLVFVVALFHGAVASAHVGWFFPYDLSNPPLSVDKVFNSAFVYLYIISIVFIYFFSGSTGIYIERIF